MLTFKSGRDGIRIPSVEGGLEASRAFIESSSSVLVENEFLESEVDPDRSRVAETKDGCEC